MNDDTRRPRRGRGIAVLAAVVAATAVAVPASAGLIDGGDSGAAASGAPDAPVFLPVQDGETGGDGWGGRGDCPDKGGGSQDESSAAAPSPQATAEL